MVASEDLCPSYNLCLLQILWITVTRTDRGAKVCSFYGFEMMNEKCKAVLPITVVKDNHRFLNLNWEEGGMLSSTKKK